MPFEQGLSNIPYETYFLIALLYFGILDTFTEVSVIFILNKMLESKEQICNVHPLQISFEMCVSGRLFIVAFTSHNVVERSSNLSNDLPSALSKRFFTSR